MAATMSGISLKYVSELPTKRIAGPSPGGGPVTPPLEPHASAAAANAAAGVTARTTNPRNTGRPEIFLCISRLREETEARDRLSPAAT
jgi:hypothetical protein